MLTVSHPSVNQYVRALVRALERRGELQAFNTTIAVARRSVDIPKQKIHQHPCREALRLLGRRCGSNFLHGWISVDAVAQDFDRHVAKGLGGIGGVYCYEDSALATFQAAADGGLKRYYELPILYWQSVQRLLREEAERYPDWEPTLLATRDSEVKLERKCSEVQLAALVICPSRQVQESLPPGTPSVVAEYGCPEPTDARPPPRSGSPLRVLFVGAMSQRKGLADLFAAMKLLNRSDVQLVVLGAPLAPLGFYRRSYPYFIF